MKRFFSFARSELGLLLGLAGTLLVAFSAVESSHGVGGIPGHIGTLWLLVFLPARFRWGISLIVAGFLAQLIHDFRKN